MAKSPLAQAFGLALQSCRINSGVDITHIVQCLGNVSVAYYKALEAGTHNLHVSNSSSLCLAFSDDNMSLYLPGVIHMLGVLSILEVTTKNLKDDGGEAYAKAYHEKFVEITKDLRDPKMKVIREKFEFSGIFRLMETGDSDVVSDAIKDAKIHHLVEDFIKLDYETFDAKEDNGKPKNTQDFPSKFFDDISTVYTDFLSNQKEHLKLLPTNYNFSQAWNWEKKNKHRFKTVCAICEQTEFIVSELNLRRYDYSYLWEKDFEHARFIFLNSSLSPSDLKKKFIEEVSITLKEKGDPLKLLPTIDDIFQKVHIGIWQKNYPKLEIATYLVDNSETNRLQIDPVIYNTFWIFELSDGSSLGVKAGIPKATWVIDKGSGSYLNYGECKTLLSEFDKRWAIIKNRG